MTTSKPTFFTVISPEGEIKACRKTGQVLNEMNPEHPHYHVVGFNVKEYIECYHEPLPDRINFRDLSYAERCGDTIEVNRADPYWRINRDMLTKAAADPKVQIIETEFGPEILCVNSSYSTQLDAYLCTCGNCLSEEHPAKYYHLHYPTENLPREHQWPEWEH